MPTITIDFSDFDFQLLQESGQLDWTYPDENGNDINVIINYS